MIPYKSLTQVLREENETVKLENQHLKNHLARLQQAFRVLNRIDEKIRMMEQDADLPGLIHELLELALHASNTENGSMVLLDEAKQELEFVDVIGSSRDALMHHRIAVDTGIVGEVIRTGIPVLECDVHRSARWSTVIDDSLDFKTESLICAPLMIDTQIFGAIELVTHQGDAVFDEHDLNVLAVTCCYIARAIAKAEALLAEDE